MRAVIQRVSEASVTIDGAVRAQIGKGYLVLLGCENADTQEDIEWLSKKVVNLRVFDDEVISSRAARNTMRFIFC